LPITAKTLDCGCWSGTILEAGVADEYERVFCTPEAIHSTTEDYRASAAIDLVECPAINW
jgi:hypothetical protein